MTSDSRPAAADPAVKPADSFETARREAREALRQGRPDDAARMARTALAAAPDDVSATNILALALHSAGRTADGIAVLEEAAAALPDDASLHANLGELHRIAGATAKAAAALDRAIALDPDEPVARLNLGRTHLQAGDLAAAEPALREAIRLGSTDATAHRLLANILRATGRTAEAEGEYATALVRDANDVDSCLGLAGLVLARHAAGDARADLNRAAELARRAIACGAAGGSAELLLGKILIELKEFADAAEVLERAAAQSTVPPDTLVTLSAAWFGAGQPAKALEVAQRMVTRHPGFSLVSRRPEADVLVLGALDGIGFPAPRYGAAAYARANTPASLPAERVSLHYVYIDGIEAEAGIFDPARYGVVYNNVVNAELVAQLGYGDKLARIVARLGRPVVNAPAAVARTSRAENYRRLGEIPGLVFPRTVPFDAAAGQEEELAARIADEFDFPVLLRHAGSHRADSLVRADDAAALRDALKRFAGGRIYAIQFHESRHLSGLFMRYRAAFIGGRFYPSRMYLDHDWLVSGPMQHRLAQTPIEADAALQQDERRWISDPGAAIGAEALAALEAVDGVLGLDCYGIDFGIAADGRPIVFEANASMDVLSVRRHVAKFPYLAPAEHAIRTAVEDLLIARAKTG